MIRIGKHQLPNRLILAPMAGITDHAFRDICIEQGAGLAVAEMLTCNTTLWESDKNRTRLVRKKSAGPESVQIAGSDPKMMAEAAKMQHDLGADIIDINMGCPAKKVLKKAAGSALLKDIPLVRVIIESVVNAVEIPVTLKIRTGWCPESRNGIEIARIAEDCGIQMLAVHGRTRECRFVGDVEYDTIAKIKQSISIPVIANGDIQDAATAKWVMDYTGADGLMIGRAAQGNPWIFQQINYFLDNGTSMPEKSLTEIRDVLLSHMTELYGLYGDFKGSLFARKHVGWYTGYLPEAHDFKKNFNQLDTPKAQVQRVREYFAVLINKKEAS